MKKLLSATALSLVLFTTSNAGDIPGNVIPPPPPPPANTTASTGGLTTLLAELVVSLIVLK